MFSPDVLLHMTAQRNAVYVCSKSNRPLFDRIVSKEMEPRLLDVVEKQFRRDPALCVRANVTWTVNDVVGEFDLVVYDPRRNAVCHVQAKAPVPPQGARMVERLEDRVAEGLDQLRRFRSLDVADRDRVLSGIFGQSIGLPELHELLITRTSFGTVKTWEALGSVVPTNPQLLKGAIDDLLGRGSECTLPDLVTRLGSLLDELVRDCMPYWQPTSITLGDPRNGSQLEMSLPLLKLNGAALQAVRVRLAPA